MQVTSVADIHVPSMIHRLHLLVYTFLLYTAETLQNNPHRHHVNFDSKQRLATRYSHCEVHFQRTASMVTELPFALCVSLIFK